MPPKLSGMNTKSTALLFALFIGGSAHADEIPPRYELTGDVQLDMEQEIFVPSRDEAVAGRRFSLGFAVGAVDDSGRQPVELTGARASYDAHGMNQRLPATHLVGTTFTLAGGDDGFRAEGAEGEINLGQVTDGGLVPGDLLAGLLPALPGEPLTTGSTWISKQRIETLEGWSWAGGDVVYDNEVTGIRQSGDTTIVTVSTTGRATLHAAEGRNGFVGEGALERTIEWSFEAASGRLVDYSLEQEAKGTSQLPQGEIPIRQQTRVKLRPT